MKKAGLSKQKVGTSESATTSLYTYRITWSEDDQEYLGLCSEFPGLSWLDKSPEKALKGIRKTVAAVVELMQKDGEEVPQPFSRRSYSGNFMVRMSKKQHQALVIEAAEEGVSLNQLAIAKLAR